MNATMWKAGGPLQPARKLRLRQKGFAALVVRESLPGRFERPGLPARVARAHARFEHEARQALRDWLMV